ncbi:MAG TPA: PAS domain-containing protein, partial [Burkholderiaceae bacterium]|nr:PAS domain-containing protein [Burkholderiaceae bacterium]
MSTVIPLRQSAVESSLKQTAFDHLALAAVCVNASGQVLAANGAALTFLGARADEVVGRHLSELLSYRSARAAARRWARLWSRLQLGHAEVRALLALKDGRRVAVEIAADALRFENETVAAMLL